MKSAVKTLSMALCAAFVLTPLAAASAEAFDVQSQVGPNPVLPDIQQYLFPQMHLSSVAGWKNGETPTVAAGLKIEALANDLQHPRSLYATQRRRAGGRIESAPAAADHPAKRYRHAPRRPCAPSEGLSHQYWGCVGANPFL
jgi:glucose/arabinose dehydrogenase